LRDILSVKLRYICTYLLCWGRDASALASMVLCFWDADTVTISSSRSKNGLGIPMFDPFVFRQLNMDLHAYAHTYPRMNHGVEKFSCIFRPPEIIITEASGVASIWKKRHHVILYRQRERSWIGLIIVEKLIQVGKFCLEAGLALSVWICLHGIQTLGSCHTFPNCLIFHTRAKELVGNFHLHVTV